MEGREMDIRIETRFNNGAISFRMSDNRLIKLSKSTLDDMMRLVKPGRIIRGEAAGVFTHFWLNSVELIAGPDHVQREEWESEPVERHGPYIWASEFVMILGLLTERDLTAIANFVAETQWRNAVAYRDFMRQRMVDTPPYFGDRSDICTVRT
jgi:hypothetical protein